jgi:hypothetical protein
MNIAKSRGSRTYPCGIPKIITNGDGKISDIRTTATTTLLLLLLLIQLRLPPTTIINPIPLL